MLCGHSKGGQRSQSHATSDNDVCGSLRRRLQTRATLGENQSGNRARKTTESRKTDRTDTTERSSGKAAARRNTAARCVVEFKQRLTSFLEAACGCANSEDEVRAGALAFLFKE